MMIAIAVFLAAKAVRKATKISRSAEGVSMGGLQESVSSVRVRFGRLKRIASQIGTAFA